MNHAIRRGRHGQQTPPHPPRRNSWPDGSPELVEGLSGHDMAVHVWQKRPDVGCLIPDHRSQGSRLSVQEGPNTFRHSTPNSAAADSGWRTCGALSASAGQPWSAMPAERHRLLFSTHGPMEAPSLSRGCRAMTCQSCHAFRCRAQRGRGTRARFCGSHKASPGRAAYACARPGATMWMP